MKAIYILLFQLVPLLVSGQNKKIFKIEGYSDFYNNKELMVVATSINKEYLTITIDSSFKLVDFPMKYVKVTENAFEITGKLEYPTPIQILFEYFVDSTLNFSASSIFFVDEGTTKIQVNDLANTELKLLNNTAANIEYEKIRSLYRHIETKDRLLYFPDVSNLKEKYTILTQYVKQNPDSYIALWITILDYSTYGYTDEIYAICTHFSDKIKDTEPFKVILTKLNNARTLLPGSQVVSNTLPDIYRNFHENKYTLIEFWASWCKPCLENIPGLKDIYSRYKNKGFEIYGISQDRLDQKPKFEKILKNYKMPWHNLMAPEVSERWNINSIPFNFLVDTKGTIVAVDMKIPELEEFLKAKL